MLNQVSKVTVKERCSVIVIVIVTVTVTVIVIVIVFVVVIEHKSPIPGFSD